MKVKKLNAWLSLLLIIVLLLHMGYQTISYLIFYYNPTIQRILVFFTAVLIIIHAALSMFSVFVLHDSRKIVYKKLNARTLLQRISAGAIVVLLPLHISTFRLLGKTAGTNMFYMTEAAQALFHAAILLHVSVSFSNALISAGLLEDERKRYLIDRCTWVICAVLFLIVTVVITYTQLRIFGVRL